MATDWGLEVLFGDTVTEQRLIGIISRLFEAVSWYAVDELVISESNYSAGSTSTNQYTITVDPAASTDTFAIRFLAQISEAGPTLARILEHILAALGSETLSITHAASYTAGDRDYNMIVNLI